jgi:predicted DCC family thiol-disulfide oxidoreductase YuxK
MLTSLSQGMRVEKSQIDPNLKIVFFDGVCHLCNGFVDFAIQNETEPRTLVFAPLQGTTAQNYLSLEDRKALSSVLLFKQSQVLHRSDAILAILRDLRFPWPWLATVAEFVPRKFRDLVYDWIAKNRYAWFGQRDLCRLPKPEEKNQLWP